MSKSSEQPTSNSQAESEQLSSNPRMVSEQPASNSQAASEQPASNPRVVHRRIRAVVAFLRNQPVLLVSALAALLSMIAVPPSPAYLGYIDARVIALLFCLMLCVSGLQLAGFFAWLAQRLLQGMKNLRFVAAILVLITFLSSMLITNDVALLTFVPFSLYLMMVANKRRQAAFVVVLQTIAANMGSMVTPFGNPQNLFLFSRFGLSMGEFFACVAPFAVLSLALLLLCLFKVEKGILIARFDNQAAKMRPKETAVFALLFALGILAVVDIVALPLALTIIVVGALATCRSAFRKVDYALLGTFVCFFIFSGNIARIEAVCELLVPLMETAPFATSLVASQVISNVPAAVLLAPFAGEWQPLLLGVDVGGLGTPVASLASLISLELYRRSKLGGTKRYLALFLGMNAVFLMANCILVVLL